MTAMPPLRSILNDTPATAVDVDWNFQTVEDHIATEVINRDGSVAMAAPLNLLGAAPSLPTHAIPKSYVDSTVLPVGIIWMFAGGNGVGTGGSTVIPAGWAMCDGATKSTTDPAYAALFAVIKYTYGGSGGNFLLPNMRGRIPVHRDSGVSVFDALGEKGGDRDAAVVTHTHPIDHNHPNEPGGTSTESTHDHDYSIPKTNLGGWSTKGNPSGWVVNGGAGTENILFGNAAALNQVTQSVLGTGHNYSTAPTGWFQEQGYFPASNLVTTQTDPHFHDVNLSNFVGTSGAASSAEAATDRNLPPYIVLNFIIRIG
ncbi:MAG TPA: phage tail protein [Mycobacterium sp.]|nr:phage tail protein [Mycobacterium sp.]